MSSRARDVGAGLPFLEHFPELDGTPQRINLNAFPFRIGRNPAAHFIIYSKQVSKDHAEIFPAGQGYFAVRDLNSTNGTFVNGQAVAERLLRNGDILHIAHKEFRFGCDEEAPAYAIPDAAVTERVEGDKPLSLIHGAAALRDVIERHQVEVVFQPIVNLRTQETVAFEALGRGAHQELSRNPGELFRLAEKCKLAPDLSRLFRLAAVRETEHIPGHVSFFFNIHPSEMEDDDFVSTLGEAAGHLKSGGRRMVLEVHEDVVANTATMRQLRDRLREMSIGLAYDDFGAGQTRLAELAEAPPDFVKLDMKLIRAIDQAPARQDLVQALSQVSARLGVQMIAEGIETRGEAEVCQRLGCFFGQGYQFGRPAPAASFTRVSPTQTRKIDMRAVRERLRALRG